MKKLYKLLLICLLTIAGGSNTLKAQSYNNDDSKSSSRAVTPTYISKIAVAYGAEASTPKNILNNQGFTIIDYDLNKGCGSTSHYIYMGYKTTTNPAEAITGIFFRKGNNPPNYDTFDGVTAYLLGESNETNPGEDKAVDLNVDAGGDYIYTYVTRNTSRAAVLDGLYFDGSSSASGYVTPNVNLNSGTKGGAIYLHYKQFSGKASATFHYLNSSGNRTSSTTSVSVKHHQQAVNNTPSAPTSVTYDGRKWTLLGWREDNNATTAGSNPSYTYMDSKVYRAVYSADVSITYNANGGSNVPSKQTAKQYVNAGSSSIVESNTSFTIPSTTPTHDATKCNFAGWSTSSSSTTAQYQAGGSISINTNTTLYAVWPKHNGTQTYVNNGSNHTYTWSCCQKSVTEDHIYDNGIDNYCGAHIHEIDGNGYCNLCNGYPAELVNGYYQIKTADNLFWFAEYVNTIDRTASAKLMNDIDLENRPWTPIGTTGETSHNFRGHFDGNGKTITGLNVTVTRNGGGFFGEVRLGTVEDFTIYGEVKLNGNHSYVGGVIGSAPGANSNQPEHNGATIRNITSYVNVTLGEGSHGSNRVAGFIGYANHETLIENCTWYGTLDLDAYRAQDGVGGLVGKANDNSEITIRNCAAYGTIKTSYQSGSYNSHNSIYIGGIVSNSVASAQTTLENCIWAGTLIDNTNLGNNAHISAIGTLNGIKSVSNCYALDNMPYITTNNAHNTGITKVTAGQLASGEIAYKLQGTQATQIWGQNIDNGETADSKPILGGAKVYGIIYDGDGIYSNTNITAGGKCGDNLYWHVDDENTLTIFGTGAMYDYGNTSNKAPWRSLNPAPKSLVLEDGITHIGKFAFYNCYGFTGSLTIPNSVTSIGNSAFYYCNGFTGSLTIPNSVTSIGNSAFYQCSGFTGDLTIPNSVTTIGNYAFQDCSGFTGSLTIPNSVTTIGMYAFSDCSGFTGSLTIPNSVTTIEDYAFSGCSSFTGSLTIPNSVTTIGNSAFRNCSGFTGSLTIPNSVTSIGNHAFSNCSGFTGSLTISNSVTTIEDYAFSGCSSFTGSLTIGNSVTTIGNYAFQNCSSFTGSLTIPNSVTTIGNYAFDNCSGFTGSLTIPNSITYIGNYAFYNCEGFTEVYSLAKTAPTLKIEAFTGTNSNATLYYPASSEQSYNNKGWFNYFSKRMVFTGKCGDNLFWYVNDNTLTIFGTGAMEDYDNIDNKAPWRSLNPAPKSLVLEEGITYIGNYAFYGCDGFTEVHSSAVIAPTLGTDAFANINENATLYYPSLSEHSYEAEGWFDYFPKSIGYDNDKKCGDKLYWNVDDENTLTIFGIGAMYDYGSSNKAPWRSLNPAPTSLVLEEGITSIGDEAFYQCSGFTGDLTIPNSVTSIGEFAFALCSGFTGSLTIGNSVTTIGDYAFYECLGFNGSLTIPNSVTSIGDYAFQYCSSFTGSLTIGNSVTSIGDYAFYYCKDFTGSLTIPNSVTSIRDFAFDGCSSFTGSLIIGNSVTSIGNSAFYDCEGFTEVYSSAVTAPTLGTDAFANINENATLYYPVSSEQSYNNKGWFNYFPKHIGYDNDKKCGDNLYWNVDDTNTLTIFGTGAMYDYSYYGIDYQAPWRSLNPAPTSLVLEEGITTIGNYAFYNCKGFTGSLTIPNSVTTIGDFAFAYCSGFTGSLTIPNSVTTIGDFAFDGCSGFTGDLTIGNSVTYIGNSAFQYCSNFTGSLTIGNSVTSIGNSAFYYCNGFTGSLTIPNSVTSIGNSAFYKCSGFTGSLTIPNSVTSIGDEAFAVCRGFTGSLTIGNSVTSIGNSAFVNCSGFKGSLTIPNSVTTIGNYAFYQCSSFTEVYSFAVTAPTLGQYVFDMPNNATLYYPVSSEQSYNNKGWFNYFSKRMGFNGKCGDNLYWNIDDENTLTIFGTSAMDDYDNIDNKAPWLSLNPAPTSLVLEKGITYIGNYAFYECYDLTDVHSSAVTAPTLGTDAFANINENATLYYPSLSEYSYEAEGWFDYFPKSIGYDNDKKCGDNLYWNVDDENTLTIFGTGAMYDYDRSSNKAPWRSLNPAPTSLVLEEGITSIGNYAFYECSGFKGSLTIPNSVTSIGMEAFRSCIGFDGSLTIPNSVTSIGDEAFRSCIGFDGSLTIPNSVTSIGDYAFQNCSGFNGSLTIPNSVTTIGDYAFQFCSGFTEIFFYRDTNPTIGSDTFSSINDNAKVYAPVIWEFFDNIPEDKLVKMPTFVGQQTTDASTGSATINGWIGLAEGHWPDEDDHVAINAPLVLGSQQDYKTTRLQAEDDGGQQSVANSLSVKSFGLCGNENTTNGSSITIEDGGQLYCEIANGEVTVKKEILGYQQSESESESRSESESESESKWYTIASPLKDAIQITPNSTNPQFLSSSDPQLLSSDLYRYDEPSHTWQNAKNSANNGFNTIEPGRGYLYANAENTTLEFTGNINTETVTYNLTAKSDVLKGFHLIGNPFTHDIYLGESIKTKETQNIIFELNDSYGDGWNGNALKLSFSNGTPDKIITMESGNSETETISVATGVTVRVSFMKGDSQEECSFTIKYDDETVICGEYSNEGSLTSVENGATLKEFTVKEGKDILVNGYYTLTGEGAWAAEASTTEAIKPMQGILVKSLVDDYELKIYNTSNQPSAVSRQRSGKGQQTTDNGQQSLCISVSNAKYSDRAFVVFDKGVGLDKMNHENENIPLLYIPMEDADYAIAMMDINVNEIPVNFETNVMGEYTISLRQENCEFSELYLLDKETNTTVNILEEDYTFIATSNYSPERFVLLMKANGQQTTDSCHFAYVNNNDIVIYDIEGDADIKIFDALGRCVYQGESSDETTRIANGYSSGVYMIHKIDDNGVNVQKIIL